MNNTIALLRANRIGDLPTFGEFASPMGISSAAGVASASAYLTYLYTGNAFLAGLTGLASAISLWAAQRYHERGGNNEGFHPLTDPPVIQEQKARIGSMDAGLTGIYRKVYGDESIAVERMESHPRFVVHIIHHDDVHLDEKKKLRTLSRRLGIETEPGHEPPFQIIYSWGKGGASAIVMPKAVPQDVNPPIIPFDTSLIQHGVPVSFLGVDIRGRAICNDRRVAPHMQVMGTTGSGKTIMIRNQIFSDWFAFPNAVIYSIDYKGGIKSAPHTKFTSDMIEGVALMKEFLALAAENWRIVSEAGFDNWFEYNNAFPGKLPPLFMYIDEYPQLKSKGDAFLLEQWEEEKAVAKESKSAMPIKPTLVNELLGEGVMVYRAGGAFYLVGGQKFPAKTYPTEFFDMFDSRVAMRVKTDDASRQCIDVGGAENLPDRGGMMFRLASNPIQIGAAAFMTLEQRHELMNK